MGIRPDEVSGAVYVFSDPLERRDAFHRRMICRAYPKAQSVDVPMVGHHVTRVFAGTTNLLDVIEACQAGSRPELVRLARKLRVASIFRGRIVFERAYRQHALLLGRHLAPAARRDPQLALSYEPHFFRCAGVLAAQSNVRRLRQFDDEFGDCLATANGRILWAALVNHVQGRESRLISFHQKEIAYSTRTGACVQAPFGTAYKPGDVPVRMHLAGSQMMLYVMLGDVRVDLWPDAQGLLSPHYGAVPGLPFPAFNVTPLGRGAFALEANGKYLSAEPHGRVICDRPVAQRWESFRIDGAAT